MRQSPNSKVRILRQTFGILLGTTIAIWLLRGFGILTFISSGIIALLLLLAIATGVLSRLQSRWSRFN